MALLESVILLGTRAAQPAATAVAVGTLYSVTNEANIVERSNGTAWQAYSPAAGGGGTTVTNYVIMAAEEGEPGGIGPPGPAAAAGASSKFVQKVNLQTGAVATGTTVMPLDDTIPQNTEGDEYMTLAITPTSATNQLEINVVIMCSFGTASRAAVAALFQDTTAGALAGMDTFQATSGGDINLKFTHFMLAGTTSATTFKVRIGPNAAATLTFNGGAAARKLGGVMASSITIEETVP